MHPLKKNKWHVEWPELQLKLPSIIFLSVYPWSPTPLFYVALDPRPGSHMVLHSDNPEDHLSPGQCWPSGSPSSDALRAFPVMPSIPQASEGSFTECCPVSGMEKRASQARWSQARFQTAGKIQGGEERERHCNGGWWGIKKKWHVKLEYYKTNTGLQGTMSKWVWLIQRKNKIFN